jgi:hypothetical protein
MSRISLNVRHRVLSERCAARGTLTGVEVHPRDVFRPLVGESAAAVIFLHWPSVRRYADIAVMLRTRVPWSRTLIPHKSPTFPEMRGQLDVLAGRGSGRRLCGTVLPRRRRRAVVGTDGFASIAERRVAVTRAASAALRSPAPSITLSVGASRRGRAPRQRRGAATCRRVRPPIPSLISTLDPDVLEPWLVDNEPLREGGRDLLGVLHVHRDSIDLAERHTSPEPAVRMRVRPTTGDSFTRRRVDAREVKRPPSHGNAVARDDPFHHRQTLEREVLLYHSTGPPPR